MTSSGCGCSVLVLLAVGPVLPGQTDPPTAALLFLGVSLKATRKKKEIWIWSFTKPSTQNKKSYHFLRPGDIGPGFSRCSDTTIWTDESSVMNTMLHSKTQTHITRWGRSEICFTHLVYLVIDHHLGSAAVFHCQSLAWWVEQCSSLVWSGWSGCWTHGQGWWWSSFQRQWSRRRRPLTLQSEPSVWLCLLTQLWYVLQWTKSVKLVNIYIQIAFCLSIVTSTDIQDMKVID